MNGDALITISNWDQGQEDGCTSVVVAVFKYTVRPYTSLLPFTLMERRSTLQAD